MLIKVYVDGNKVTFQCPAEFNFNIQREFRALYEAHPKDSHFVLDFNRVEMIDSAVLGMLLIFKEYAGGERANITILHCNDRIRNMFKVAHFTDFFPIS